MTKVTVISTALPGCKTRKRCEDSVAEQVGVDVEHIYVVNPILPAGPNVLRAVRDLPPERIVALVDGDDWLSGPHSLEIAAATHTNGNWVTYGSYRFTDGRLGHAAKYPSANYRREPWLATHLKTVRAGLLQRVTLPALPPPGYPWDIAMMLPCLEMAGEERVRFIPHVLYVYNYASSYEFQHGVDHERAGEISIRHEKPYERLENL